MILYQKFIKYVINTKDLLCFWFFEKRTSIDQILNEINYNFLIENFQTAIDPMSGMKKDQALDMAKKLGFKDKLADEVSSFEIANKCRNE